MELLVITAILIFCITLLAGFFGVEGERLISAYIGFAASSGIAAFVWLIAITAHFVTKYW